jgi:hypothetical protein
MLIDTLTMSKLNLRNHKHLQLAQAYAQTRKCKKSMPTQPHRHSGF